MTIEETKHKGHTIKVFFDQELGYLFDIWYPTFSKSIVSKPHSFETEEQALECAFDWIDELTGEYFE